MIHIRRTLLFCLLVIFIMSCGITQTAIPLSVTPTVTQAQEPPAPSGPQTLTILYTGDEHGWMEGVKEGQGAANLMALWKEQYGYDPKGAFLALSGGDNWTGPAISTWFQGQGMVEVMNLMGYRASALGNHEFDFGLQQLKQRISEASFPYLSANLRSKKTGQTPVDLGIKAYTLVNAGGVKVGIIGLSGKNTAVVTNPANVADFDFISYEQALREAVPQVRREGASLIVVDAHLCMDELIPLVQQVQDLNIAVFGGGHCNEQQAAKSGSSVVIAGGDSFKSYAWVKLVVDPQTGQYSDVRYGVEKNQGSPADPVVAQIVARWHEKAASELDESIGYLKKAVPRSSQAMVSLITEAWLWSYPAADAAITNQGGMRDKLPAGDLTLGEVVSMMPFDNVLVDVKLTGAQLLKVLKGGQTTAPTVGGLRKEGTTWILKKTGKPLDKSAVYHLLVNDFMYNGGDNYGMLAKYDPKAYNTGIDWRQPVIDWIKSRESSESNPLDASIAELMR